MAGFNFRIIDCAALPPETHRHIGRCQVPRCSRAGVAVAIYDYVTGKGGRISDCRRWLCAEHTRRFCSTHALALPWPWKDQEPET